MTSRLQPAIKTRKAAIARLRDRSCDSDVRDDLDVSILSRWRLAAMADSQVPNVAEGANEPLPRPRLSTESNGESNGPQSPSTAATSPSMHNEHASKGSISSETAKIALLQAELGRMRAERDTLDANYRSLLEKITAMRNTLGNKLRQDAEELDRREQLIQSLTAQNEDLQVSVDTLNTELVSSNEEAERLSRELDALRNRALQDNAYESSLRERDAAELEHVRQDRDEWERVAIEERVRGESLSMEVIALQRQLQTKSDELEVMAKEFEQEKGTSVNLQSVLEDFQSVKELELKQALAGHEAQLHRVTTQLAEFKHRAFTAEDSLSSTSRNAQKTEQLEQELREKNLLIGKLRHEAVIANEHLTEALRRLRKSSPESNVDRRLVTNILLQFLGTPRADPKRFEMLTLLSSILSWDDNERERAGLQRAGVAFGAGAAGVGRRIVSSGSIKATEKGDESESFSKMWVEFLLKESTSSTTLHSPSAAPLALTPAASQQQFNINGFTVTTSPPHSPHSPTSSLGGERRSPYTGPRTLRMQSLGSPRPTPATTSSPNLLSSLALNGSGAGLGHGSAADSETSSQSEPSGL
ncbi:uncharacterized protein EI90DRAFT_3057337 [Cantharellus anzutake]|uniref:uncharacterized protein n=1 Tax=Cantharellus anzutake TaxID=1750568 RepID=UPI0019059ED5|nr:uncharacterized protein EI90DRAFT_3057337 [Cantharellus anzutake]KAF8331277.1 hypothetical protein EI90DRAFT_3057337 [Cantharellus anzutake]